MIFNKHSDFSGCHAFLSASNYHWVNYTEEKLLSVYGLSREAQRGVAQHEFARHCIVMGEKLQGSKKTLNRYVNDAIGFRMTPEQVLFYSVNAFGTADAISFRNNLLRIHDLKTGVTKASFKQLEVYTALFCLEYEYRPGDIKIELRLYKDDDVEVLIPELDSIAHIMDRIITFDKIIEKMKAEV